MLDALLKKLLDYKADAKLVLAFAVAPVRYRDGVRDPKRTWGKMFSSIGLLAVVTYLVSRALPGEAGTDLSIDQIQLDLSVLALQSLIATLATALAYRLASRRPAHTRLLADICLTAWLLLFVVYSLMAGVGLAVFESLSPPPALGNGRLDHFLSNMMIYLAILVLPAILVFGFVVVRVQQHLSAVFEWRKSVSIAIVTSWLLGSALVILITPPELTNTLSSALLRLKSLLL